jgi:hypothetical protein
MSRLDSGAYAAFWAIADATGIRPEYLIPVLGFESGLDPSVPNGAGAPYYGIGQNYGPSLPTDPQTYLTWPASRQLSEVVLPYFAGQVRSYGPMASGIRVYQAEFYPASLKTARGLDDVVVRAPSAAYESNTVFDTESKGYITPRDLGAAVRKSLGRSDVRAAIDATYALRPWEWRRDSVYGDDFGMLSTLPVWAQVGLGATAVAGAFVAAWWTTSYLEKHPRALDRFAPKNLLSTFDRGLSSVGL